MSKKRTMGYKIQKPPSEDEEEGVEEAVEENQDDFFNFPGFEEHAQENRNKELLDILGETAVNTKQDHFRLTWQAFYCLKKQEMDMNRQMMDEIDKIKDKYELMKQPIYTEISNAVLGNRVRSLQCDSLSKISKSIPEFWVVIFTKAGILNSQMACDLDGFRKLKTFTCELLDNSFSHYRIRFTFHEQSIYFSNKELEISIKAGDSDEPAIYKLKQEIKYKLPRVESSFFTQLFDNNNAEELASFATEINQSYRNALYFYFSKYHSGSTTSSQVDEESHYYEHSSKKIKSQPSSADKLESNEKVLLK